MPDTTSKGAPGWQSDVETLEQQIAFNARLPVTDDSVRCLVCGSQLQYITHSHVASHPPESPRSVEQYKSKVSSVLDVDADDVPVVSSDLQRKLADETRDAWKSGKYDHFRIE